MTELTIVMPVYNEGERIYRNLIETVTQVEKFSDSFRIIAVNDGSSDESKQEIERAAAADKRIGLISYDKNKGKGYLAPAVILFALLSVIGEIGEMERPEALIAVLVGAVILVVILATVNAVKKHSEKSGTPVRSAARPAARTAARTSGA